MLKSSLMKRLARSVAKEDRNSIVCNILKDNRMKYLAVKKVGNLLRQELINTCSSKSATYYQSSNPKSLMKFKWADCDLDLKRTAPLLHYILESCVKANRSPKRSLDSIVLRSMIGGILLRNTNERVNIVQQLLSVILYGSRAPKQVDVY